MDCLTCLLLTFCLAGPAPNGAVNPIPFVELPPGGVDSTIPVSRHDLGRFPPRAVCEHNLAWYAEHRQWMQWRADTRKYDPEDFWGYWNVGSIIGILDGNADVWRALLRAHEANDCGGDPVPHLRDMQRRMEQESTAPAVRYWTWNEAHMPPLYERSWVKPLPDHRDRLPYWGQD